MDLDRAVRLVVRQGKRLGNLIQRKGVRHQWLNQAGVLGNQLSAQGEIALI